MTKPTDVERTRHDLEHAETGDTAAARKVEKAEQTKPRDAEAAEQEAADGPKGRGLAR